MSEFTASTTTDEVTHGIDLSGRQVDGPVVAGQQGGVEACATDPAIADRLWALSEPLAGEAFA